MNEELKKAALMIVVKHGKGLAMEMVEAIAIPALEAAAKNTATPVDDIVIAALKEPLKQALIDALEKIEV